jgi:hypothetical protein
MTLAAHPVPMACHCRAVGINWVSSIMGSSRARGSQRCHRAAAGLSKLVEVEIGAAFAGLVATIIELGEKGSYLFSGSNDRSPEFPWNPVRWCAGLRLSGRHPIGRSSLWRDNA